MTKKYPFSLEGLPYSYEYLEPVIDRQTMEIHHGKHHQAYVDNLNKLLDQNESLKSSSLEELMNSEIVGIKNNAGGVWNHDFFWKAMTKADTAVMSEKLKAVIDASFGSVEAFKAQFEAGALSRFGSGWVWLVKTPEGALEVMSTANQDSPLSVGKQPVLGLDVWEHAYYLKYQNRRGEYAKEWLRVVNWEMVEMKLN